MTTITAISTMRTLAPQEGGLFDEHLLTAPNTTKDGHPLVAPLVSFRVYSYFALVNDILLACSISLFGIFSNTANIVVFIKMGFAESTNISFFTLSVMDLCICVYTIIGKLLYSPWLYRLHRNPQTLEGGHGISFMALFSIGVSAWVTAIISLERCFCIMFPLKVKTMITKQRIVIVILLMSVYQAVFAFLIYIQTGPPYHSKSELRIVYLLCCLTAPSFICFFVVVVATSFLVFNLKQTMKNRSKMTASQSEKSVSKERKVVRPVIFICAIFIVCQFPNVAKLLATIVYPKFTLTDPYLGWLSNIFYTFTFLFQSVSSSTNIFVYYHMSTKFKDTFKASFCASDGKK